MVLSIFIILTWFVISVFTFLPKSFSFIENSFIFLFSSVLVKNSFTIVGLNLKWIEGSSKPEFFLSYFLYRTLIYPISLLTMMNLIFTLRHFFSRFLGIVGVACFIFCIEILGEQLKVYSYKQWSHWYFLIEVLFFTLLTFAASKYIHYLHSRKSTYENI